MSGVRKRVALGWKVAAVCCLAIVPAVLTACGPTGGCSDTGSCASCDGGEVRTQPPGFELGCYAECAAQSECDTGEECKQFNGGQISICVPANYGEPECVTDEDCVAGEVCGDQGECGAAPPECVEDEDCDDGDVCVGGSCVVDYSCATDDDCGGCEVCAEGVCVSGGCPPPPSGCVSYCENLFGACVKGTCEGLTEADVELLDAQYDACLNGGTAEDGSVINPCTQDYLSDPQFAAQVDQFAYETCGSSTALTGVYCGSFGFGEKCDCVELTIGASCEEDEDCEGGELDAICVLENDADTGEATGYVGGYCISGFCDAGSTQAGAIAVSGTTGCGTDGMCINEQAQNGVTSICYDLCSANADCRDGYACEILGFFASGDSAGRCMPACETNEDCPAYTLTADPNTQLNSFCNADEWCEIPCDPDEAGSCGTGGELACTVKAGLNETNDFKGSCSIAGE